MPTRIPPRIAGSAAGTSTRLIICQPVARKLRAISSSRGSTDRMPTIVAMATGKNTMSVLMTSLLDETRAEPQDDERREREDGRGLGGDEVRAEQPLREPGAGKAGCR